MQKKICENAKSSKSETPGGEDYFPPAARNTKSGTAQCSSFLSEIKTYASLAKKSISLPKHFSWSRHMTFNCTRVTLDSIHKSYIFFFKQWQFKNCIKTCSCIFPNSIQPLPLSTQNALLEKFKQILKNCKQILKKYKQILKNTNKS